MGNSPLKLWGILVLSDFTVTFSVNDINQPQKCFFEVNFLTDFHKHGFIFKLDKMKSNNPWHKLYKFCGKFKKLTASNSANKTFVNENAIKLTFSR